MSLYKYLTRIERLDGMIRRKSTGPPEKLARKLDISERWLYKLLKELKMELDCPITYDRRKQSYVYEVKGQIVVGFQQKNMSKEEKMRVNGGLYKKKMPTVFICSGKIILFAVE